MRTLKRALKGGRTGAFLVLFLLSVASPWAFANPDGPSVVAGDATVAGLGTSQVTIHQTTPQAILHWQQFNIAPNEVTQFIQPSAQSIALNRIFDANPSQILGRLQANGSVILLNPNGILFGQDALVNVNGLIASSLDLKNEDFLNGRYQFGIEGGSSLGGAVTNQGTIEAGTGGVYLFAPNVVNNGMIRSPEGQILLAAGASVFLSPRPDGNGFLWEVRNPTGEAANLGTLIADGGRIGLSGRTVRQAGMIQANSVREKNGRIELVATDRVDITGSQTVVDRGELSIRQTDMQVDDTFLSQLSEQSVQNIELQADNDLIVASSPLPILLSGWPSNGFFTERTLNFIAGKNLRFNPNLILNLPDESGIRWDIKGSAGMDVVFTAAQLWLGNGGGFDLNAGRDILLEQDLLTGIHSYLWAMDGGNIRLRGGQDIIAPNIFDTNNSYNMFSGIRLAGESSTLTGPAGDLTIEAGRDFLGGFTLANGDATISTGGNFGRSSAGRFPDTDPDFAYANLNLGSGTIQIHSRDNIYLGRIQDIGLAEANQGILDPANAVTLVAETGNIHLNPIPDSRRPFFDILSYYPPSFTAIAEEGNIFIERNLTFWPSLTGSLDFFARQDILGTIFGGQPTRITLLNVDPSRLHNKGISAGSMDSLGSNNGNPFHFNPDDHEAAPVRFRTQNGDISTIQFLFKTALNKEVTIFSGRDLKQFIAHLMVPEGTEAVVHAERNIEMNLFRDETAEETVVPSGIFFYGTENGTGRGTVYAGGNLDLGDSNGIEQQLAFGIGRVSSGLIDISVGGDLRMTTSKIYTYNGASISIHGTNGPESAVGGTVDVGTNDPGTSINPDRGIATVGGGSIDILATRDVNVNASRVATFGGGDIRITSTEGSINAGFGGANDIVTLAIPFPAFDSDGNPVLDSDGKQTSNQRFFRVPGSGIFTFHDSDPNPLSSYPPPPEPVLPPPFEFTPEMERLQREMIKRSTLGQDISTLEAAFKVEADLLSKAYQVEVDKAVAAAALRYEEIKAEHRKDWKLGDITLTAKEGSVVVPPAGIRGRKINIDAKTLDLQGGEVSGDVQVSVVNVVGTGGLTGPVTGNIGSNVVTSISLPSIPSGGTTGGAGLGGLSGSTGSISAASSGSVSTASAAVATVQEKVVEQARAEEPSAASADPAASSDDGNEKRTEHEREKRAGGKLRSLQIRRGVVIQVEVNDEQP